MMKSHAGTDTGKWKLLDGEEYKEKLNTTFGNARTDEAGTKRERESRLLYSLPSSGGSTQFTEGSCHGEKLTEEYLDEIQAIINDEALFGDGNKVTLMTICDLGGQEPFLASHVALMPPGALSVYMLVFNGAKLLTDKAKSTYRKLEGESIHAITQKLCRMETNGDFLKHWASSVHIAHPAAEQQGGAYLGEAEGVEYPAIFRVATHRWEAEEAAARCAKGETSIVDFIRENNDYVRDLFQRQACQCHFVRPSSGLKFFLVENKTSGTRKEDTTAKEIRSRVDAMTDDYWTKQAEQPARWLKFEVVMGKLAKIIGRSVSTLEVVKQVAEKCYISDDRELEEALLHLTHVGAVYYFPDVPRLQKIVFHDSDWLFKLLASFVGSAHSKSDLPVSVDNDWDVAVYSGFLSCKLVNCLLRQAEVKERDYAFAKGILCHFDVLIEKKEGSEDKGYYAPCFLQDDFTQETKYSQAFIQKTSFSFPLIVYAKDVLFFPEALFFRLTTRLIRDYRLSSADVPLKRNRLIFPLSHGVNAEFLYQGSRNFVSLTIFSVDEKKPLMEEHMASLSSRCSQLREWLIKNVNDAKQRGMAGLQAEFYCQVKKIPDGSSPLKSFAPMEKEEESFSMETTMWTLRTDRSSLIQLNKDELDCMKLWLGAAPRMLSEVDQAHGLDLSGVVSKKERRAVAQRIRANWRSVGEVLGPDPTFEDHELDGFGEKESKRDRAQAMLDAWARKHHKRATRRMLILALKEESYGDVIVKVFKCDPVNVK
ncbi:uncharacterized protein [Oscarella lobularis]|uniref:uncharacterized protein isoform X1 n=2 Tax=Oscarella lobularis TaxID=121494 RepID=UPI0033135C34